MPPEEGGIFFVFTAAGLIFLMVRLDDKMPVNDDFLCFFGGQPHVCKCGNRYFGEK